MINMEEIGCKGELKELGFVPKLGNYVIEVVSKHKQKNQKL